MTRIESKSDRLIKSNGYNPIHFYGVILSYFNYYDYNIFEKCFNKLYENNPEDLYEILLIYYSQFFNINIRVVFNLFNFGKYGRK